MIWRGSYGEISGASSAVRTSARTMRPPTAPRGLRLAKAARTVQGAPRAGHSARVSGVVLATIAPEPATIPSSRGIALLVPHPGIEHAIRQIDQQVEDQDDRGDEDDDRLQHDEVPVDDALDQQRSHARHDEDGLDDDHAAQEPRELIAGDGQDRQERVLQRVPADDGDLDEALG